jgi:hypothetical protein
MVAPPRKRRSRTEQRQALEMLAGSPLGVTEDLLVLAHGFNSDMIAGLVRTGLATARRESIKAGGNSVEIVRIRITDAGRKAIEDA